MAFGRPKLILSGLVGVTVIGGLILGLTRDDAPKLREGGPPLSGTAPAALISGPSLSGGSKLDLASYKGKTVIVNAWASWCGPCRNEAPAIVRFAKEHPDVVVLGVNLNDDKGNATTFNTEAGWTHPSIYDPNGKVGFDKLKVTTMPTTVYVDKNGVERGRTQGEITYEDLVSVAKRLP